MNLCNCIETEEMALILYIHSHNHVNIQCLPTRTVHVCLNLYLPETKHGNQTERQQWCHGIHVVAVYADRRFFSTVIAIDFTVNQNQGVCNANQYTRC